MANKDFKKWLDTECPKEEIKYMDEENKKGAYIPIGIIEQNLDEFDDWGTYNWQYTAQRIDKGWVASGSIQLYVKIGEKIILRHGSTSFPIGSKLNNNDFEATAMSLAISNAAKKLGKRFGRHLNGRLDKGETIPVVDLEAQRRLDAAIDEVLESGSYEKVVAVFEKYPEYQKNREFVMSVSNTKHILKIKETPSGK